MRLFVSLSASAILSASALAFPASIIEDFDSFPIGTLADGSNQTLGITWQATGTAGSTTVQAHNFNPGSGAITSRDGTGQFVFMDGSFLTTSPAVLTQQVFLPDVATQFVDLPDRTFAFQFSQYLGNNPGAEDNRAVSYETQLRSAGGAIFGGVILVPDELNPGSSGIQLYSRTNGNFTPSVNFAYTDASTTVRAEVPDDTWVDFQLIFDFTGLEADWSYRIFYRVVPNINAPGAFQPLFAEDGSVDFLLAGLDIGPPPGVPNSTNIGQVVFYGERSGVVPTDFSVWDNFTFVPEPASLALLGLGSLIFIRRRRAKA